MSIQFFGHGNARCAARPLALAVALALGVGSAHAANIIVNSADDPGSAATCTVRQAVASANNDSAGNSACVVGSGADSIDFDSALANATLPLDFDDLRVTSTLTINGSGQTLDAGGASRVIYAAAGAILTVSNVTMTGGNANHGGGLLVAASSPSLSLAGATVTLSGVTVTGNTASMGGGIYVAEGDSRFPSSGGSLSMTDTTVSGNVATDGYGGGLLIGALGQCDATDSTISDNLAYDSNHDGFVGGGIYGFEASVSLVGTTVSGNRAISDASAASGFVSGGAYFWRSEVSMLNATIAGNSAAGTGQVAGGLSVNHSQADPANLGLTLINTTVSGNTASSFAAGADVVGGILIASGTNYSGAATMHNTIVAGNSGETSADLHAGNPSGIFSADYSLLGSAAQSEVVPATGNIFSDTPGLAALADNGGPTQTMALLNTSPGIDVGSNALLPVGLSTDQRGIGFDRVVHGSVDIGAYEFDGVLAPPVSSSTVPVPIRSPWALGLLGLLMTAVGVGSARRRGRSG